MTRKLQIEQLTITDESDCFVIAEIGNNHQGELQKAMEMFKAAKECGVDAVKLQKRDNKSLLTKAAYEKPYDNENSFGATYGEHREALEFGKKEYVELKKYADELGLVMFATAFDMKSADFLAELDMPLYKIASGDLKNTPLLKHVAKIGKPMIISTGGGTMEDVQRAYDAIMPINKQLAILQCTASYPAEPQDLNLRVITTYREAFPDVVIGLSDHENGIAMALAAYVLASFRAVMRSVCWEAEQETNPVVPVTTNGFVSGCTRLARPSMNKFNEFDARKSVLFTCCLSPFEYSSADAIL